MQRKVTTCSKCKAKIFFAPTEAGKCVLLDFLPVPQGNYLLEDKLAVCLGASEIPFAKAEGHPLYLDHFATCPDAEEFRKYQRGISSTSNDEQGKDRREQQNEES